MTRRTSVDPLAHAIEIALDPGGFVGWNEVWSFVDELHDVESQIAELVDTDPVRATSLYELFLAGAYQKAEEIDDSSGSFGMFVDDLICGWVRSRQASAADPDETARWLLARMDDDPYGFTYEIERNVVAVLDRKGRDAFERQVRSRFDQALEEAANAESDREARSYAGRRWADILRAIYASRRNVQRYVEVCERTMLTPGDCETLGIMLRARGKPDEALAWVERGLSLAAEGAYPGSAHKLTELKRALLAKLGRGDEALTSAWDDYRKRPSRVTYEALIKYVPEGEQAEWHERAMTTAEDGDLGSLIELWLSVKEIDLLVSRLGKTRDAELEALSHYATEPAAKRLDQSHPEIAARLYRAMGLRILAARKSKYYGAALSNLKDAKRCYTKAGLTDDWDATVAQVRREHSRKSAFLPGFEQLVAGHKHDEETFLERARQRWTLEGN